MTRWLDPPQIDVPASLADLNLPPLLARTLAVRGLTDISAARAFLHPDELPPVPYPNLAPASQGGISEAVNRTNLATRNNETICVWGDFDVDGQTSTTLLVQTLRSVGAKVVYYVPIRGKESHGVHIESLKPIIDNGATLIVTCDTGITAHEAIDYANSRGVDVIVTDHHDLGETLPSAKAIINPKMLPADHLLANLAGVGVAYKFAEALIGSRKSKVESQELLDLVALGLIADVALLKGETRSLAQKGIQKLRETKRLGLRVMADLAGASMDTLTEETIGFTFAPRLNALGRLGDANPAVELLLTNDPSRARVLAAQIEGLNAQRRMLTSQVYESAEAKLRAEPALLDEPVIMLSHPNWPGGVVGIVANKLVERYHKPAILFSESDDGILRGSARSVEGLHITEAIATQKEILRGFGGHPMAAGMSLEAARLAEFRRRLGKAVEAQLGSTVREESALQIDAWLRLDEVNLELADSLEMLAPFGAGNPELTLATRAVTFKSASAIGKTKEHLRLNVEDENGNTQSLLWWGGAGGELPEAGSKIDVAYSVRGSSYRGQRQVSVQFQEFRVVEEKPIEVRESVLEIRDLRLQSSLLNLQPSTLIWAEGPDRSTGVTRLELTQADELTIYTTPPSPAELRKALEIVKPKIVYVFAKPPVEQRPDEFLTYLAGLCKYVVNQRGGKTSVSELASASAATDSAIEVGLQWLAAGGQLSVTIEEDEVTLSKDTQEKNPYLQAELFVALRGILNETVAYRKFFATVEDLKGMFNS
jgi:single-stranded-DNA-specific exonuclease